MPVLRRAVAERLIAGFARKNGIVAAAVFVPGADLPVLALNELRLLLRLEQAYGLEIDLRERLPELAGTLAAGFGLRGARPRAARPRARGGLGCQRAPSPMRARARSARPRVRRLEARQAPGAATTRPPGEASPAGP